MAKPAPQVDMLTLIWEEQQRTNALLQDAIRQLELIRIVLEQGSKRTPPR